MLAKRSWLFFLLAASAFYLYGIGRIPLVGPDEPRYAQVAREMFMRGDPITPTLAGHPWFEKPALLYWMMMLSFGAFGVSEWSARLGPACAGLLSALLIYWMGRSVERASAEPKRAEGLALWSGVALASSAGLIVFSRGASFDIILTLTVTAALACFLVSEVETDEKRRRWLVAGFYASIGASLLAKGLVGIIIPGGVVATYFLFRRRWPDRGLIASAWWGVPLAIAIAALWYGPIIARHGWTFIDDFFIQHHFARYVSNKYRHPQRFYFYIPIMALLTLPWTPFLVAALVNAKGWHWRGPETAMSKLHLFALAWLVMPIAFFSLSGSKLPGYILPALPAAALLIGERLAHFLRDAEGVRTMRATGALLLLLAIAGVSYAARTHDASITCALLVVGPLVLAGALAISLRVGRRQLCVWLTVGAMFATIGLALNCAVDRVAQRESVRELMQRAAARGYASTPVVGLYTIQYSAEFYAADSLAHDTNHQPLMFEGAGLIRDWARQHGELVLVLVPLDGVRQLTEYTAVETEIIGDNGVVALIAVRVRG